MIESRRLKDAQSVVGGFEFCFGYCEDWRKGSVGYNMVAVGLP